jgi:hypothetical protein
MAEDEIQDEIDRIVDRIANRIRNTPSSGKGLRGEPKRNAVFVAPTKPRLSFWAEAPWSARGLVP